MIHDWQILSCSWLAHVAWLHTLAGIHRGSDLYHSGPTLDQTVVFEARPCDIICLSVLQCWRQPRVWPEQRPWPPGSGQGGSDPLWHPAHHVLRLNSWAHQRSTCNSSFFLFSESVASLSACRLFTLLSYFPNLHPSSSWMGAKKICCLLTSSRFFVLKEQPTSQPAFPLELPFKPAIQCCETSEVFPVHKKKTKIQVEPLFSLFSIWMSALLCL